MSLTPALTWNAGTFAVSYDVYLGTSPSDMALVANVPAALVVNPPSLYSFTPGAPLQMATTYYWQVVSRTFATPKMPSMVATSATWAFTTMVPAVPPAAPASSKAAVQKTGTAAATVTADGDTATPIKHLIVLLGENRTFDHVFGTFEPDSGQSIFNLLSQGIMNADGSAGPNYARARQWEANVAASYSIHPAKTAPYSQLPAINVGETPATAPFATAAAARAVEPGLPFESYDLLTIGGSGLSASTQIDPLVSAYCRSWPVRRPRLPVAERLPGRPGASLLPELAADRL